MEQPVQKHGGKRESSTSRSSGLVWLKTGCKMSDVWTKEGLVTMQGWLDFMQSATGSQSRRHSKEEHDQI